MHYHPETPSRKSFDSSSFVTPIANRITPRSSPPPLCRERKRDREGDNIFQDQDGNVYPQFLIPEFGPMDSSTSNFTSSTSSNPGRKPLKFNLRQRLPHPSLVDDVSSTPHPLKMSSQTRSIQVTPVRLSSRFEKQHNVSNVSNVSISSLRSNLSDVALNIAERPKKLVRRASSNALSA